MNTCIAFTLVVIGGVSGCIYQNFGDTCAYLDGQPFYAFRPDELNVIVGSSQFSATQDPWLRMYEEQDDSALEVLLERTQTPSDSVYPVLLEHCSNIEAREFELAVENEEWSKYWSSAKDRRTFSMALAMPGLEPPVRTKSFGFALVAREDGEVKVSCGCFAR